MAVRIGFTGDVMLGRLVDDRQRSRPTTAVWGDVLDRLRALDGLVVNLECCVSTRGRPWRRTNRPFHFRADPDWAIPALTEAGVDVAALANNHALDFEVPALADTLDHLAEAGIASAGAGEDLDDALEPAVIDVDGLTVAVVAFTDNTPEFAADGDSPGTAHVKIDRDNDESRSSVRTALDRARRAAPDLLVASLHWGPNMVTEPPAAFREFGRWLIEEGVDVLHGHSAHVFQGIEVHDGRPILYDTGDFVDDYAVDETLRNDRSFLFVLELSDTGELKRLTLEPTEIYDCAVHLAADRAADWSCDRMVDRSEPFGTSFERRDDRLIVAFSDPTA